jgi:hypothetical protein
LDFGEEKIMKQTEDGATQITVTLHGVRLTLRSEQRDFIAFARAYLASLVDNVTPPEDEATSHIHVQLTWDTHPRHGCSVDHLTAWNS